MLPALAAANAFDAGAPSAVRPAAAMPPLTRRPRRVTCAASIVSRTSSFICGRLLCRGGRGDSQPATASAPASSSIRDGTMLVPRAVGGAEDVEGPRCRGPSIACSADSGAAGLHDAVDGELVRRVLDLGLRRIVIGDDRRDELGVLVDVLLDVRFVRDREVRVQREL